MLTDKLSSRPVNSARAELLIDAALAVTLGVGFIFAGKLNSAIVLWAGLATGGLLALLVGFTVVRTLRRPDREIVAAATLAAWLLATAVLSADSPHLSLWGQFGQHSGAATWLLAAVWLMIGRSSNGRGPLRRAAIVSAYGVIASVWAFAQFLLGSQPSWGSAPGPFENSSSLGAFLAVALVCATYLLMRTSGGRRFASISAIALMLTALAVSESRLALAGVISAALVYLVVIVAKPGRAARTVLSVLLPLGIATASIGMAMASAGVLGDAPLAFVRSIGNERHTIWNSALAQYMQAPLFGRGLEQFSAWVLWDFSPTGGLTFNGTYDPHSFVLALALGGGAPAVIAWGLWYGFSTHRSLQPRATHEDAMGLAVVTALWTSSLFSWITPAAVLAAFAVSSTSHAENHDRTEEKRANPSAMLPVIAGTIALIVCAFTFRAIAVERSATAEVPASSADAGAMWQTWPDPAIPTRTLRGELASGASMDLDTLDNLFPGWSAHRSWHADLALASAFYDQSLCAQGSAQACADISTAVDLGEQADPASGVWRFTGAMAAASRNDSETAALYAREALVMPLPEGARSQLEALAR